MAEQLADHWQRFPGRQRRRGVSVPKIVDARVVKPGPSADAAPRLLEISETGASILAYNE